MRKNKMNLLGKLLIFLILLFQSDDVYANSLDNQTVLKFLDKAAYLNNYIKEQNYSYGSGNPSLTKEVNCISYVTWVLQEIGYVDDIYYSCGEFYKKYKDDFIIITDKTKLLPGDIVFQLTKKVTENMVTFQETGVSISHVAIYQGKNDLGKNVWYDAGSTSQIRNGISNYDWGYMCDTCASREFAGVFRLKQEIDMDNIGFENKTVTYDGIPKSIEIVGNLPKGILKVNYSGNNKINAGVYTVNADFLVEDGYKTVSSKKAVLTITKANPNYQVPKNLEAFYGQKLSDIDLPEGFNWENDENSSVGNVGKNKFKLKYTPKDTNNYNVITGIEVDIDVKEYNNTLKYLTINDQNIDLDKCIKESNSYVCQISFDNLVDSYNVKSELNDDVHFSLDEVNSGNKIYVDNPIVIDIKAKDSSTNNLRYVINVLKKSDNLDEGSSSDDENIISNPQTGGRYLIIMILILSTMLSFLIYNRIKNFGENM